MSRIIYSLLLLSVLLSVSCKKETQKNTNPTVDPLVKYTADTFNDMYLWYSSLPTVDLTTFKTPAEYISAVHYVKDRWSFTMTYTDMQKLLQNGETTGWGLGLAFDKQQILRVLYVYDNSAMGKAGVKRGWQIKGINGKLVSAMSVSEVNTLIGNTTNTFDFIKNDGTELVVAMSKGAIVINSVLYSSIYPIA